jgi:hypothetical protein
VCRATRLWTACASPMRATWRSTPHRGAGGRRECRKIGPLCVWGFNCPWLAPRCKRGEKPRICGHGGRRRRKGTAQPRPQQAGGEALNAAAPTPHTHTPTHQYSTPIPTAPICLLIGLDGGVVCGRWGLAIGRGRVLRVVRLHCTEASVRARPAEWARGKNVAGTDPVVAVDTLGAVAGNHRSHTATAGPGAAQQRLADLHALWWSAGSRGGEEIPCGREVERDGGRGTRDRGSGWVP